MGGAGLSSHVVGDVFIQDGRFWSGCLSNQGNQSLSQTLVLQKKKKNKNGLVLYYS